MPFKAHRIGDDETYLGAIFAVVFLVFPVQDGLVLDQTGSIRITLGTQIAGVLVPSVIVFDYQVFVQSERRIEDLERINLEKNDGILHGSM